jgi:hypothetical protein
VVIKPYNKGLKEFDIFIIELKIIEGIIIKSRKNGKQIPSAIINDGQLMKIMIKFRLT